MQQTFSVLIILFLFSISCHAQETVSSEMQLKVDAIFAEYDDPNKPGVAVGIMRNGKMILQKGYGSANLEYDAPIDPAKTRFPLCSTSKQFTVLAIMLLVEDDKLSLDDDIRKHLTDLPDYGKIVKVGQLTNHTSGIRSDLEMLAMKGMSNDNLINEEMIHSMIWRQKELSYTPGDDFIYSNAGFALLAEIVERVSEMDFHIFMEKRIFQPLGMDDTFVMDYYENVVKNRAYCYSLWEGDYYKDLMNFSVVGSTGVFTTVEDMGKWVNNFKNPKVGTKEIFKEMETLGVLNNGRTSTFARGQFVDKYKGLHHVSHGGASSSFRANLSRFPEQDFAVVVMSNYRNFNPNAKTFELVDLFLEQEIKSLQEFDKEEVKFVNIPAEKLEKYTGNYIHQKYNFIRNIVLRNDSLILVRPNQGGRESLLLAINEQEFQMEEDAESRISFKSNGEKTTMHLTVNGEERDIWDSYMDKNLTEAEKRELEGVYYSEELNMRYNLEIHEGNITINNPDMYRRETKNLSFQVSEFPLFELGISSLRS